MPTFRPVNAVREQARFDTCKEKYSGSYNAGPLPLSFVIISDSIYFMRHCKAPKEKATTPMTLAVTS